VTSNPGDSQHLGETCPPNRLASGPPWPPSSTNRAAAASEWPHGSWRRSARWRLRRVLGWEHSGLPPNRWKFTLVNIQKTMENHHFLWENPRSKWPCSIAMSVYQRVLDRVFPGKLEPETPIFNGKNHGFRWRFSRESQSNDGWFIENPDPSINGWNIGVPPTTISGNLRVYMELLCLRHWYIVNIVM